MTPADIQKLVDSLKADAMKFKNKGEIGYASGLFDAARRVERCLPETAAAPKSTYKAVVLDPEPEPEPEPPKKILGVF